MLFADNQDHILSVTSSSGECLRIFGMAMSGEVVLAGHTREKRLHSRFTLRSSLPRRTYLHTWNGCLPVGDTH